MVSVSYFFLEHCSFNFFSCINLFLVVLDFDLSAVILTFLVLVFYSSLFSWSISAKSYLFYESFLRFYFLALCIFSIIHLFSS